MSLTNGYNLPNLDFALMFYKNFENKLKAVENAVASLQQNPEQWEFDHFKAVNRAENILIWYANSHYGIDFVSAGVNYTPKSVTFISSIFGSLIPWRRKLLSAAIKAAKDAGVCPR